MAKAEDDKGTDETKDNGSVRARARARGVTRTKASEAMTKAVEELVYGYVLAFGREEAVEGGS
jgi:phosphoglycerate dehydrogenase-like enzyme